MKNFKNPWKWAPAVLGTSPQLCSLPCFCVHYKVSGLGSRSGRSIYFHKRADPEELAFKAPTAKCHPLWVGNATASHQLPAQWRSWNSILALCLWGVCMCACARMCVVCVQVCVCVHVWEFNLATQLCINQRVDVRHTWESHLCPQLCLWAVWASVLALLAGGTLNNLRSAVGI